MAFQVLIIIAALVTGWIRRGSIWNLANIRLVYWWLLPIAYVLQHISVAYLTGKAYEGMIVLSYLLMLAFCAMNLKASGVTWALVGTASNFVALAANGLRMPAYVQAVKLLAPQMVAPLEHGAYPKSVAMSASTHLNFLGDIFAFDIRPASLLSIGDFLFAIGLVILIQHAMVAGDKGRTAHA